MYTQSVSKLPHKKNFPKTKTTKHFAAHSFGEVLIKSYVYAMAAAASSTKFVSGVMPAQSAA